MAGRTLAHPWLATLLVCAVGLTAAGCGTGGGVSDAKIVAALDLKQAGHGYQMGGDPFCTVQDLLNDGDQVSAANDRAGASGFVIAGPGGEVGVVAERPFAPNCSRRAQKELKRLERRSE
jgi:hypothetical protein